MKVISVSPEQRLKNEEDIPAVDIRTLKVPKSVRRRTCCSVPRTFIVINTMYVALVSITRDGSARALQGRAPSTSTAPDDDFPPRRIAPTSCRHKKWVMSKFVRRPTRTSSVGETSVRTRHCYPGPGYSTWTLITQVMGNYLVDPQLWPRPLIARGSALSCVSLETLGDLSSI